MVESKCQYPANTRHSPNVDPMLGQRQRGWIIIETTLGECLVFAATGHETLNLCLINRLTAGPDCVILIIRLIPAFGHVKDKT